jgi:hypothetical protein
MNYNLFVIIILFDVMDNLIEYFGNVSIIRLNGWNLVMQKKINKIITYNLNQGILDIFTNSIGYTDIVSGQHKFIEFEDSRIINELCCKYLMNKIYLFNFKYYSFDQTQLDNFTQVDAKKTRYRYEFKEIKYTNYFTDLLFELTVQICSYLDITDINSLIEVEPKIMQGKDINFFILITKYPEMGGLYILRSENEKDGLDIGCMYNWGYVIKILDKLDYFDLIDKYDNNKIIDVSLGSDPFNFEDFIFQYFTKKKYPEIYKTIKLRLVINWRALYNSCCNGITNLLDKDIDIDDIDLKKFNDSYLLSKMRNKIKFKYEFDKIHYLVELPSYVKRCYKLIDQVSIADIHYYGSSCDEDYNDVIREIITIKYNLIKSKKL